MGFLSGLFSGGVGNLASSIGSAAKDIEDVFTTSDREKLQQFEAETRRIIAERADRQGQIDTNLAEAQHSSMFVAGWRPFVGWVCGIGMMYHFLVFPLIGPFIEKYADVELYRLEWQELSVVLMGMLGLGGLRGYEKLKGVARNKLKNNS